jgi:hypothetical protein
MARQSTAPSVQLVNEESALLQEHERAPRPSSSTDPTQISEDSRESSIPHVVAFAPFEELHEQLEEFANDILTFEPTDPEELLREVEEQHHHEHQRTSSSLEGVLGIHPSDDPRGSHGNGSRRLSHDLSEVLTYPEEQMIESHFTSSPEKLGLVSLAVLVFYNVSGGPFGMETTVRAGGNFYAILGFLIMPFVWSLQEALMTAELGTTFPEASGGVAWVEGTFVEEALRGARIGLFPQAVRICISTIPNP